MTRSTKAGAVAEGARRSPNIWGSPDVYERENRAADPDGVLWARMWDRHPWADATVLDVGCGAGFHLPRFAERAASVLGVEPHPGLARRARQRCGFLPEIEARVGSAQALPVADSSVDVVHARWAYFFGPGCEPGLRELGRVLRRGGTAFVVDNDAGRSTFGGWFRRAFPAYDPEVVDRFWDRQGWQRISVDMGWRFDRREDFEAVVRIEFCPEVAEQVLAESRVPGAAVDGAVEVDYAVNLRWRTY